MHFIAASFVIGCLWLFLSWSLGESLPHTTQYRNAEIVAIQDGSESRGAFFIGSGVIDGKQVYSFYEKSGDGFLLESVEARDVTVYQSSDKPYVVKESGCDGGWQWVTPCLFDKRAVTEIHVPAGTIKENFVLDAK